MADSYVFEGASLKDFRSLFLTKKQYTDKISKQSLKERALHWKPTTDLEQGIKQGVIDRALVKVGADTLRVTSYITQESPDSVTAYVSYGGKQMNLVTEGRKDDMGGYFRAEPRSDEGIQLTVSSRYETRKLRYTLISLAGLIFGCVPGVILACLFYFSHKSSLKRLRRSVVTVLEDRLEAART